MCYLCLCVWFCVMLQCEKNPAQSGNKNSWCPHQKTRFLDGSRCAVLDLFLKLSGGQIAAMGILNVVNLTIVIAIYVIVIHQLHHCYDQSYHNYRIMTLNVILIHKKSGTYHSGAPLCAIQAVHCVIWAVFSSPWLVVLHGDCTKPL